MKNTPPNFKIIALPFLRVAIATIFFFFSCGPSLILAQVTTSILPDTTLPGGNNSIAAPIGSRVDITGGHSVGTNLFHSFSDFQVGSGDTANFFGQGASNIPSRVTGSNPSNLFGTLGIDTHLPDASRSNANLFFLNPNGVVFGPNSSLDLNGSFHVSTADLLRFEDGNIFYADTSLDGSADSLLRAAPPEAFGFLGNPTIFGFTQAIPAGVMVEQSTLLGAVDKTVSIVAGDITIIGDEANRPFRIPTIGAPGGQIHLVNVGSSATLNFINGTTGQDVHVSGGQLGHLRIIDEAAMSASDQVRTDEVVGSFVSGSRGSTYGHNAQCI